MKEISAPEAKVIKAINAIPVDPPIFPKPKLTEFSVVVIAAMVTPQTRLFIITIFFY